MDFNIYSTVEVLATLTGDVGRIMSKMHLVQPTGNVNIVTGIRIAHVGLLIAIVLKYSIILKRFRFSSFLNIVKERIIKCELLFLLDHQLRWIRLKWKS